MLTVVPRRSSPETNNALSNWAGLCTRSAGPSRTLSDVDEMKSGRAIPNRRSALSRRAMLRRSDIESKVEKSSVVVGLPILDKLKARKEQPGQA
jgi:hypothetical protein